jgi:hypothetical protein
MQSFTNAFVATAVLSAIPAAALPQIAHVAFLEGSWTCTISSAAGAQHEVDRNVALGASWVHLAGNVTAGMGRPAHTYDGYVGIDSAKHVWVYSYVDNLGGYGIFTTSDAPDAKTQRWIASYPPDPNGGFTLHAISSTRYAIDFTLPMNGRRLAVHQVCTKT